MDGVSSGKCGTGTKMECKNLVRIPKVLGKSLERWPIYCPIRYEVTLMRVRFWGVSWVDSHAAMENMGIGGNTSCIEVRLGKYQILIFYGGTGIRCSESNWRRNSGINPFEDIASSATFILDHIQGIPFFRPCTTRTTMLLHFARPA